MDFRKSRLAQGLKAARTLLQLAPAVWQLEDRSGADADRGTSTTARALLRLVQSARDIDHKSLPSDKLADVHGFNVRARDRWVAVQAKSVDAGARVLDVGAGTAPYRNLFAHCVYQTQDFAAYDGYKGSEGQYGQIDYVSDITSIPVDDASFDAILCTEVLEHVPRPIDALREMVRVARPGGRLFLTAPLGSGQHQEPYHFYGGYSEHWYRKFLAEFGCDVVSIEPNHGFFAHLAQECARFSWTYDRHKSEHDGFGEDLAELLGDILPRYLYALDNKVPIKEFTVGYHVEARRR